MKYYKIALLIIVFVFLSSYNPFGSNFLKNKITFFELKNIQIKNNEKVKKKEINQRLNHMYGKNILFIKKEDVQNPLKDINFLEKVEVKKKYPNTLIIDLFESKPIAILNKKDKKYIIDNYSKLVSINEGINIDNFPNIFGDGAEFEFVDFFNNLGKFNFPRKKVKNYYYFQIGRWDLQLFNEQLIKLPASNTDAAIKQSINLLAKENFKNFNIIDLRIDGKIIVE